MTVPAKVTGAKRPIFLCTVLPGGIAALTRATAAGGAAYVAMQTQSRSNDAAADLARALERARIMPSYRINPDVPGAVWWIDPGERAHIRWIRREDEGPLLDALARVHAADNLSMGEGTKFAGVFRANGVLVPVWDLDNTKAHDSWNAVIEDANRRIDAAMKSDEPLTAAERKSRETIVSRQVTIR